jgi:hypothetical protein
MNVAYGVIIGFYETIFVNICVRFKAIRRLNLAVRALFYIVGSFWILRTICVITRSRSVNKIIPITFFGCLWTSLKVNLSDLHQSRNLVFSHQLTL